MEGDKRERLVNEIEKTQKNIKRKYQLLKQNESTSEQLFSKAFKPIIAPLKSIEGKIPEIKPKKNTLAETIRLAKEDLSRPIKNPPNERYNALRELQDEGKGEGVSEEEEEEEEEFQDTESNMGEVYKNYMLKKPHDMVYGPHYEEEILKMGAHEMNILPNDDIKIGEKKFTGTNGLYSLIFDPKPKNYTQTDLDTYKNILLYTRSHLKSNGQIKSNSGDKYMNIIKTLFPPKSGKGLMTLNNKRVEYVYYDNYNELIDRLEILVREQNSGHTGHNNEIQSILEELLEIGIIKRP